MRWLLCLLLSGGLSGCTPPAPEPEPKVIPSPQAASALAFDWHWQRFVAHFLDDSGRVIDRGSPRSVSTSEGQAYGMFFALLAADRERFDHMLSWTEANLAQGRLVDQLPAWLWGQHDDGSWGILDENPASDADVWLAYALLEGGQFWQEPRYTALGLRLAALVLKNSTYTMGSDLVLLPAPFGFVHQQPDYLLVNPSYFSLSLFVGLANLSGDERWLAVYSSSVAILEQLHHVDAQLGVIPDWLAVTTDMKVLSVAATHKRHKDEVASGSYNAIRTYLWLTLDATRSGQTDLLRRYQGPVLQTRRDGFPAQRLKRDGSSEGHGSVGFSAVLLPYFDALDSDTARAQQERLLAHDPALYAGNYYDHMLLLFGLAARHCFSFTVQGHIRRNGSPDEGC